MNVDILLGKTTEHLVQLDDTKYFVHKQIAQDFLRLQRDALEEGFDLQIASAFRDYNRQLRIWNAKASGERQLIDAQERPLEFSTLTKKEVLYAILRWSAVPGCSRHHWGTDLDVFDAKTQRPEDVKLVNSETIENGPSARLHQWLDERMKVNNAYGFYRPYATDRGGVAPERWHISHYSFSRRFLEAYTSSIFRKNIEQSDLLLKEELLEIADDVYQRFFLNIDLP